MPPVDFDKRAAVLYEQDRQAILRRTDRLFAGLMLVEMLAGMAAALWLTPLSWRGLSSTTHPHVWAALLLGPVIVGFPIALIGLRPGAVLTRHAVAVGQMLMGGMLIQFTGGRIETHFIVFGALAFLAFYRDWPVLITASLVVAADHLVRGFVWPESVFGVLTAPIWRSFEHAGWVVFIDIFLITACLQGVREMMATAGRQARLETVNESIEQEVQARTAELKASEARARSILDTAVDGIIMIDTAGSVEWFNPAAERMFGYAAEEVIGRSVNMLMPTPYREEHDGYLHRYLESGARRLVGIRREFLGRRKDGSTLPVDIGIGEVREGSRTSFTAVVRDITLRKQAEEDLRAAKEAAEEATKIKSNFLATMSHEIRTPMNGVIGMTGLLLDTKLDEEQRKYAETVRSSGQALLTLINDILDFSKIEAGKLQLEVINFDLRTAVEEAVELLAERAFTKKLEIASLVHHDVPLAVRGDPGRLRQILINLIGNAIKFTSSGEVIVRARQETRTANDVVVRFEVTDTGLGISGDSQAKLFQPFSQADSSTTRKFGGTGLGLAISRQLVELMGGQIGVTSEPARGSTFWFTVRLEKVSEEALEACGRRDDLRGLRILVVDDNETNRQIVHAQIAAWGMSCDAADSGVSALAVLRAASGGRPFDLAVLDMQMPGMDGMELARTIRADARFASLRLVMMTSVGIRGHAEVARIVGIDAYLTKPVRQSQLYDCLRTVMGSPRHVEPAAKPEPSRLVTAHVLKEAEARSRTRILVVEDNEVNQMVTVRMLEKLGYRCDVAANGLEAVEAQTRVPYDALLMDCQMPEMDGYEASRAIREKEALFGVHTPIIAMTANAMQGDRAKCLAAGMDDYISKPVRHPDLEAILVRWLPQSPRTPTAGEAAATLAGTFSPIDTSVLDNLREEGAKGATGFLADLIGQFLRRAPDWIDKLRVAVTQVDADALRMAAHNLKGSSGTIGANNLASICASLETQARAGSIGQVAGEMLSRLDDEFARVREALESELDS
ncbi:MAG TPA: response regulator [Candidatus Polarisedimenticolia bacterium]|jgi:PAS domain S-box-containing protein